MILKDLHAKASVLLAFLVPLAAGFCCPSVSAQITSVQVSGVTPNQAILSYDAPDGIACTLVVSESAGLKRPVADVDTSLFPGSNSDGRFSALRQGRQRYFVIGTLPNPSGLISNQAADGYYYGRALKPNTQHYYKVTCGLATATGSFTTPNLPLGNAYGYPQPIAAAGVYAYPSFFTPAQWNASNPRTYQFRDPNTGLPMQFVTLPGDVTNDSAVNTFTATGTCTNWTTPVKLLGSRGYGVYSASSQDKCQVTRGNTSFIISSAYTVDNVQITFTGHSTNAGDVLDACLTRDAMTCATPTQQFTLAASDPEKGYCFPATTNCSAAPRPQPFQDWSYPPLLASQISANANFGVLVWKDATATGTVSLRNFKFSIYQSFNGDWYDGGEEWACSNHTINDSKGVPGYLCEFPVMNNRTDLVWIRTDTGEVRHMGQFKLLGGRLTGFNGTVFPNVNSETFDSSTNNVVYFLAVGSDTHSHVLKCLLPPSGNTYYSQSVAANTFASCTWIDMTPSPNYLDVEVAAFNSGYNSANFGGWGSPIVQNHYLLAKAPARGAGQDSHSWLAVVDLTGNGGNAPLPVVAATGTYTRAPCRWCGYHTGHPPGNVNYFVWVPHYVSPVGSRESSSNYSTMLAANMTNTQTDMQLTGEPELQNIAVGDIVGLGTPPNHAECVKITAVNGGNDYTVQRGVTGYANGCTSTPTTHNMGDNAFATCTAATGANQGTVNFWWKFDNDPKGASVFAHNAPPVTPDSIQNHFSWAPIPSSTSGSAVSEGLSWSVCSNHAPSTQCTSPFKVTSAPAFAGASAQAPGNTYQQHPTGVHQVLASGNELTWGSDLVVLDSDTFSDPSALRNVAGSLWSFTPSRLWSGNGIKKLGTVAVVGWKPLLDVSGPSSSLGGTSTDNYKYCYVYKAGECFRGSSVGTVYVNAPQITSGSKCSSPTAPFPVQSETQLCFGPLSGRDDQLDQMALNLTSADTTGAHSRSLGRAFTPFGWKFIFDNAQPTPDGKWVMFLVTENNGRRDVAEIQLPPWPPPSGQNLGDFEQLLVTLHPSAALAVNNAIVEFGYDSNFYCTSRQEACVAVAANYSQATPFYFETSDSYSGAPCSSGCTITLPVIPGHVIYYRWKYRNRSTQVISTGPIQVAAY